MFLECRVMALHHRNKLHWKKYVLTEFSDQINAAIVSLWTSSKILTPNLNSTGLWEYNHHKKINIFRWYSRGWLLKLFNVSGNTIYGVLKHIIIKNLNAWNV